MSTAMDVIGDLMVENERNKLATIIKQYLQSEVPSIVCDVAQKSLIEAGQVYVQLTSYISFITQIIMGTFGGQCQYFFNVN